MKTPFNIPIPPELPLYRKAARLVWQVILRLIAFVVIPFVISFDAFRFALRKDSISRFDHNFWKAYRRSLKTTWYWIAGYDTAGYYRLFHPDDGCGPYVWFREEPKDPQNGSGDQWRWGKGY